jgi:chromate reductase
MWQPHVLAIAGSLRRDSFNRRLLEAAARCAPPGVKVRIYADLGGLPHFNEDDEVAAFAAGPVRELTDAVAAASGLLIATPEYNHSVPGVLKNALDWLSRPLASGVLSGKPIAVIGASSGSWGTRLAQAGLRQVLFATESRVLGGPTLYLPRAAAAFDREGCLADDSLRPLLRQIVESLSSGCRSES